MKALLANASVVLASRIVLGMFFIIASIDKIGFPDAFAANIFAYKLVPVLFVNAAAIVLPWLELVTGVFLVAGVMVRPSAAVVGALLVVFIFAMAAAIIQGLKIDCGCFGKEHATPVSWTRVLEDVGLLLLAAHLTVYPRSRFSVVPEDGGGGPSGPAAVR